MIDGLVADNFAGGGGASTGIEQALRRPVDVAVNHDAEAIALHRANHPGTRHFCESVWRVDPETLAGGRPVALAWFSPDCKHFSKARGARPVSKKIRGLAWVALRWARRVRPRVIALENVEEFQDWGPVDAAGAPCPLRKGFTFRRFVDEVRRLGYAVEWRELRACDYGAPTVRKRLFLVARCDGMPIVWPAPTHGPAGSGLSPYRTAADIIDWSIPCPSIFERKRPLAEATCRRIARGIYRFVIEAADPFFVTYAQQGGSVRSGGKPLHTITASTKDHNCIVAPTLVGVGGRAGQSRPRSGDEPLATITAKADTALVAPTLIQTGYGERPGQAPRVPGLDKPLGTVVAGGGKHALVAAFLAQHNTGVTGHDARAPLSTLTARCTQQQLVTSHLVKLRNNCDGQGLREPLHTLTTGGHFAEVRAFLIKYYGQGDGQPVNRPLDTVTTKDRFGLVTVPIGGVDYAIADIGMRMLCPRELFRAQGFPDDYVIDADIDGKPITKTAQVRMAGNSVCPPVARAVVEAQFGLREEASDGPLFAYSGAAE